MSLSDDGLFDPLTNNQSYMKFWIDDFLVASMGIDDELAVLLDKFLYRLRRLGLKINLQKSSFFVKIKTDTFKLLGFQVKKGKIFPDTNTISIIKDFTQPSCKTELQQFLGYLTFVRDLLPHKLIDLITVNDLKLCCRTRPCTQSMRGGAVTTCPQGNHITYFL